MAFMLLEIFFFGNIIYNFYIVLTFFFFVYLFPGFIMKIEVKYKPSGFDEGAIKHILRSKVGLYGFEINFWQNLTDVCLLSICCSF